MLVLLAMGFLFILIAKAEYVMSLFAGNISQISISCENIPERSDVYEIVDKNKDFFKILNSDAQANGGFVAVGRVLGRNKYICSESLGVIYIIGLSEEDRRNLILTNGERIHGVPYITRFPEMQFESDLRYGIDYLKIEDILNK